MRILVACEFSGRVRDAFRALGHDAISCDLLPTESPGPHLQCDVRDVLYEFRWDMMIAHPPCTHLAVSGARWFKEKREEQKEAIEFVRLLMNAPIDRIAVENPVGVISTKIRKPDQIVQPWWFGDPVEKLTCLWLRGLPKLRADRIAFPGKRHVTRGGKSLPEWYNLPPSEFRWKVRSITFPGVARAMAEQWGNPK